MFNSKLFSILYLWKFHKMIHIIFGLLCIMKGLNGDIDYYLLLSVFLCGSGIHGLNDIFDIESDKIEHCSRPIVSGRISIKEAYVYSMLPIIIGLSILMFLVEHSESKIFFLFSLLSSIFYTFHRYLTFGDYLFEFLTYFFLILSAIPNDYLFAFSSALWCLAYNITIQKQDLEGDIVAGQNTIPMKISKDKVIIIVVLLLSIASVVYMSYMKLWSIFLSLSSIFIIYSLIQDEKIVYEKYCRIGMRLFSLVGMILLFFNI